MMSEEYPIKIIRGLLIILICEIMITISKKSEMLTLLEKIDKVELNYLKKHTVKTLDHLNMKT